MSSIFKTRFQNRTIFELNRVIGLHTKLPSDALRLRARELIRTAKISESTFLPYADTAAFAEALLVLGVGSDDVNARAALHHAKHHFNSSCGNSVAFLVSTLGATGQKVKSTDFKTALFDLMLRVIQTLSSADLSVLFRAMAKHKVTDKMLWACIAEQLLQEIGTLNAETISSSLFCMAVCKFYSKEYVDECERVVLSSQLHFTRDDLVKVVEAFRAFNRPVLSVQLMLKRTDIKPAVVISTPTHTKIEENATKFPTRQPAPAGPAQGSLLSLTLSEKETLDRKVRMVLPGLPLEEIAAVISATRQKGAETIGQIQMAVSAVSSKLKTATVTADLVEDITLTFIRSPFLAVPEVSYAVEDVLRELYELEGVAIVNMDEHPKNALRQVSVLTDAVEILPRLRATRLIGALMHHIKTLGPLFEKAASTNLQATPLPLESVPSYVFHAVRLLSACNSPETLDANRGGICHGIHGLVSVKAASLALTVAKLPPLDKKDGRPPLNIALLDAIVDVLLHRGVKEFPPTLSCQVIEALHLAKVNKTILVLNLMEEISRSARSVLTSASAAQFDAEKCITAMRKGMSMLSSEKHGLTFQDAKGAAVDTVTIVLRSSSGVPVLCEALRIMATVITCDASRMAMALRRTRLLLEKKTVSRMEKWMGEVGVAEAPPTPNAGANDVAIVEDLARRLRATLSSANAFEVVSILTSLSMLRNVPQLQHPLLTKELPLLGIEHAIEVLGSASSSALQELVVATKEMDVPFEVMDRFRSVCGKALLRGLERESGDGGVSQWSLEKACSFADVAHFITVNNLENAYYVPSRFGAVLWSKTKNLLEKERSLVSADSLACVMFLIAIAYQDGHIAFTETELKLARIITADVGRSAQCSALSLASVTFGLTLFGVPFDVHPLQQVVSKRRLELLGHSEALALLSRKGHDVWLGIGRDLSHSELNQMSQVINDALRQNLSKAAQKDTPLFDINSVHASFTQKDSKPLVSLVRREIEDSPRECDFVAEEVALTSSSSERKGVKAKVDKRSGRQISKKKPKSTVTRSKQTSSSDKNKTTGKT